MAPEGQVGVDALHQRQQPQLLQATGLRGDELHPRQVGQGRSAPQGQRLAQAHRARGRIPGGDGLPALVEQALEPRRVELIGLDAEHVAARRG